MPATNATPRPEPGVVKVLRDLVVKVIAFADVPADQDSRFLVVKSATGANEADVEWLEREVPVVKMQGVAPEERFVLGPVMTPDKIDGQGELAPADTIRRAAHDFMASWRLMDDLHNLAPLKGGRNAGIPVESYIAPHDMTFDTPTGPQIVPAGSWMLGVKVQDEAVWDAIKKGTRKGFSVWGGAKKDRIPEANARALVRKTLPDPSGAAGGSPVDRNPGDEQQMDDNQIAAAIKAAMEPVTKQLTDLRELVEKTQRDTSGKIEDVTKRLVAVEPLAQRVEVVEKTSKDFSDLLNEPVRKALKAQAEPSKTPPMSVLANVTKENLGA